jgi:prophage maintenance system killer protein
LILGLFYLCKNRPLIGESRRTALGACLVFLRLNGIEPKADGLEWEKLPLDVAASIIDREETTARLRRLLPKRR